MKNFAFFIAAIFVYFSMKHTAPLVIGVLNPEPMKEIQNIPFDPFEVTWETQVFSGKNYMREICKTYELDNMQGRRLVKTEIGDWELMGERK